MLRQSLYPLLFMPNLHEVVWGGNNIQAYKGLERTDAPIGESWEVSAVPSSSSVVANGVYAGRTLVDVISEKPAEILGEEVSRRFDRRLPLLVKFIDAKSDLSIQVHPDDEMSGRKHGKLGKTEMWYVIDAQPDSFLYAGFSEKITPDEYKRRISDGTITDVLAKHTVKPGDVFYIPAGRVHAICGGILLAEVQQSSDVTYRIYDYNRPGIDGKPRELHTELAAEALDFEVHDEYRTIYCNEDNRANHMIDSPFFSVRVVEAEQPFHRNLVKYDSFIITMCIKGCCDIKIRETGDVVSLTEGHSCLIPAVIADYDVVPVGGSCRLLDAFIDCKDNGLDRKILRFLHLSKK